MASLTADNTIQSNSGISTAATSHVVLLPSGTTAGNTLIIVTYSGNAFSAVPTGFTLDAGGGASTVAYYRKSDIAAGETSWTFSSAGAIDVLWYVEENDNIDPVSPMEVTATGSNASLGNGGTLSTGTTARNAGLSVKAFAGFGALKNTGAETTSWSGYTNGFEELVDLSGSAVVAFGLAQYFQGGSTGTFSSTVTFTRSGAAGNSIARVVVYRAKDALISAPLALHEGFEWGTHAGLGNTGATSLIVASQAPSGTWGTNYLIQSGSARNSSYGLRVVQSASVAYVPLGSLAVKSASFGFNVRVVSATGTVVVAEVTNSILQVHAQLLYDSSTNKFGARAGSTGTTVWQTNTTATNTWVWVDFALKATSSTYEVKWKIETGAADGETVATLGGQSSSGSTFHFMLLGSGTSQTMTADYDDFVESAYYVAHPLGSHQVRLLVPETTGASVSGTSANFNEFTANGTLAAFASTSGQRIDEVPPTISAASDGVVQVTLAASDYMQFPMTTYTCAADEIIAAVRMLCSEWGGTGTGTGTLGFRGYDGTTETTFIAASASYDADSLTTASATYPLWKCAMWSSSASTNIWSQTQLNNAALRVGFSTDATPDMGISAAYLEVAIRKTQTVRQITLEDPMSATVDLNVHPYNSASVAYVVTNNDATRSVNFNYSISGTPQTPVTVSPSTNQTVQVNADNYGDISDLSLEVI